MRKRNRILALLFAGVMSMSALMTGCGNDTEQSTEVNNVQESTGGNVATESATPEDNTLKIAIHTNTFITDYEDNYLTHYFEDKLGIEIEFELLPATNADAITKISLMANGGGELPDILLFSGLTAETIAQYGKDGLFLTTQDYLTDTSVMPNFNKIPDEDKTKMLTVATMSDGNMYSFPMCEEQDWNLTPNRMYINQAWLDKLGLKMPKTTEDLKNVLIAFRDRDPNGNGIKDEIPAYGMQLGNYGQNIIAALMNAFTFWNNGLKTANHGLALDESGKTVMAPFTTEEWKQGLLYMKDLYDEGLLAPGIFTDDETQYKATLNAETNVVGLVASGSTGNWADYANNPNFLEMTMAEPFTGPEGACYTPYAIHTGSNSGFIFADSDKVDLALKFFDFCYDEETAIIMRYGEEGVHWSTDEKDLVGLSNAFIDAGVYDKASMAIIENIWAVNNNVTWRNVCPRYASKSFTQAAVTLGVETKYGWPHNISALNAMLYADKHPEHVLPTLKYTEEETEKILDAIANIPGFIHQTMAEFITGVRDIEKGWDTYLAELESMGLSTWLSVSQDAYNRTLK